MRRSLRQAGAALVSVIPVLVVTHAFGGDVSNAVAMAVWSSDSSAVISMTKHSKSRIAEPVIVTNLAPYIQILPAPFDFIDFINTDGFPLRTNHFCLGLNCNVFSKERAINWKVFSRTVLADLYIDNPSHISSRYLSGVANADMGDAIGVMAKSSKRFDAVGIDRDVGAQLALGGGVHGADGISGGISRNAGGLISAEQKGDLDRGDQCQKAGEPCEPESVIGDPFVRLPWVNFGFGVIAGAMWCLGCWVVLR
jgi:hypothetical protein